VSYTWRRWGGPFHIARPDPDDAVGKRLLRSDVSPSPSTAHWYRGWPACLALVLVLLIVGLAYQFMPGQRVVVGSRQGLPRLWGFYWLESGPDGVAFRWCGKDGSVNFWGLGNSPLRLRLFYQAIRPTGLATVAVEVNGHTVASVVSGGSFEVHEFTAPRSFSALTGTVRVGFLSQPFNAPPDPRDLGVGVAWVEIAPAGGLVVPPVPVLLPVVLAAFGLLTLRRLLPAGLVMLVAQAPALAIAALVVWRPDILGSWIWLFAVLGLLVGLAVLKGESAAREAQTVARLVRDGRPLFWKVAALVTLASFGFLVAAVYHFRVDVPFWDEWELVPLLQKSYAGTLAFRDLVAQHNEHRPLFGRLISIGLIRASHWDTSCGVVANFLVALATYSILLLQLCRTRLLGARMSVAWVLPGLSLLSFSLSQWENWLWDWQVLFFLHVLAVVLGVALLAGGEARWWRILLASLLGVVAVYTVASGMLYWVLVLPLLATARCAGKGRKAGAIAAWVLCAALCIGYFLRGYHRTAQGQSLQFTLTHLGDYLRYIALYLATPVSAFGQDAAIAVGACGLLIFVASTAYLTLRAKVRLRLLAPYLVLGLYSVGCAAAAGTGRLSLGLVQANSSRYATFAYFLWLADLVFLAMICGYLLSLPSGRPRVAVPGAVLMIAISVGAAAGSLHGLTGCNYWYDRLAPARPALIELRGDDDTLVSLYPDSNVVRQRGLVLKQLRLSVFRDQWE